MDGAVHTYCQNFPLYAWQSPYSGKITESDVQNQQLSPLININTSNNCNAVGINYKNNEIHIDNTQ